jgi:hypothetical protein
MRMLPHSTTIASTALAAVLVAASAATANAQAVTVTGIEMGGDGFTVTVPIVEATDSNLDEAAIRGLFADDLAVLADLATLDAARIHIPEITFTYEVPAAAGAEAESATIDYRDLELLGVARGVASSAAIGGAEITSATDDTVVSLGRMSTGMLDIGGILGLYGIGDGGSSEIRPVYQDFVFEGGEVRGPRMTCNIGGAAVEEFRARAIEGSFTDLLAAAHEFEAAEAAGTPPPAEAVASFIAYYTDFLTAFESTPATFDGFDCSGTDDSGTPMRIASGSLSMDGFRPGGYPSIALSDFAIEIGDMGRLAFDNATLRRWISPAPSRRWRPPARRSMRNGSPPTGAG